MASKANASDLPAISKITLRFFTRIVHSYFRRHFRAVRVQNIKHFRDTSGPLIVYANHASWWDPMVSVLLAQTLMPERKHYAPMDAIPLARYPILRKIGIFPVDIETPRGAAQFLRTSQAVLNSGGVLWLTPQGRLADARERPLDFKPGLAALIARAPEAIILPLAVEYVFWNERLPETLLHFASPMHIDPGQSTTEITQQLESELESAMSHLSQVAMKRDPAAFEILFEGSRGTGGFYALGRRIRSLLQGKGFREDESARDTKVRDLRK